MPTHCFTSVGADVGERTRRALLHGAPWRALLAFMLPIWLGNIIQQSFYALDTLILGRFVGVHGLAAVGAVFGAFSLLFGTVFAFTAGLAIRVSQAYGADDSREVRRAFATGSLISIASGVALGLSLLSLAGPALTLLRVPDAVRADAQVFFRIYCIGLPLISLGNFYTHAIRGLGDSRTPTLILTVSGGINAIAALTLIGVWNQGVLGAALSMQAASLCTLVASGFWIARAHGIPVLRPDWSPLRLQPQLSQAGAMGMQAAGIGIGNVLLQAACNSLGSATIAGFSIGLRIEGFALAPLAAFGIAMATFTAQHLGAGDIRRLRHGVRQATYLALGVALAVSALVIVFAHPLAEVFISGSSSSAVAVTSHYLRVSAGFYPLVAIVYVLRGSLQGVSLVRSALLSGVAELAAKTACALAVAWGAGVMSLVLSGPASWAIALVPLLWAWSGWKKSARSSSAPSATIDMKPPR